MDRKEYNTYVFDLDGTLVKIDRNSAIKKYLSRLRKHLGGKYNEKEAIEVLNKFDVDNTPFHGDSVRKAYIGMWSLVFEHFGVVDHYKVAEELQLEIESSSEESLYPDVLPVLKALKSRGKKIGLLSERGRKAIVSSLKRNGIYDYFDFILSAHEIDSERMKRGDRVWERLVEVVGTKEGIIYIGDKYETDVEPPSVRGISSVIIDRENKLSSGLESLLSLLG